MASCDAVTAHKILRDAISIRNLELNKDVRVATVRIWGRRFWDWKRDIESGEWPINEDCGYTMRNLFDIVLEGVCYISSQDERQPLYHIIKYFCSKSGSSYISFTEDEFSLILERCEKEYGPYLVECLCDIVMFYPNDPLKSSLLMRFSLNEVLSTSNHSDEIDDQ